MSSNVTRIKPDYFDEISQKARRRWKQLEADPELAGPWRQLFSQVQSPRHVLSELLQNADDAGAQRVKVRIEKGYFLFEHDGADFKPEEFASLCRFGYSNKRNLHTIGFRGIGFKSTFSLGENVDVLTPSLSVRFEKQRFTRPRWIESAPDVGSRTVIRVKIEDERRGQELEKNFEDWINSPASLLFFTNVASLEIQGSRIRREPAEAGPCAGSQWFNLIGAETNRVLVVRSKPEHFPAEAVAEITKERNADDLHLPPCSIEIVFGLDAVQKIYVVLPTGVRPDLPFSINGPFLQDPARFKIKDPSVSPTNRWLLERAGKLAAQSMLSLAGDKDLPISERAKAYSYLPAPASLGDSVDESVTYEVVEAFRYSVANKPLLLTHDGELRKPGTCSAFPSRILKVWSGEVVKAIFCSEYMSVLSPEVSSEHQRLLSAWEWVNAVSDSVLLTTIQETNPPKPDSWIALSHLWEFVFRASQNSHRQFKPGTFPIAPVEGSRSLQRPDELVRLSARQSAIVPNDLEFVSKLIKIVDSNWIEFLREAAKEQESDKSAYRSGNSITASLSILKDVGLDSPSSTERILSLADSTIEQSHEGFKDRKRIAHIYAATQTSVPKDFTYFVQNQSLVLANDGVLIDPDGILEEVLPEATIQSRLIHDSYSQTSESCSAAQWQEWTLSAQSRLSTLPPFFDQELQFETKQGLEKFLKSRGTDKPDPYQYKGRASYEICDRSLLQSLVEHLDKQLETDENSWAAFLDLFFRGNAKHWSSEISVPVTEVAANGYNRKKAKCDLVPCKWTIQFSQRPCLLDTMNRPCVPAELLIRTPQTEPLMGVESFVKAEFDTPGNRPLLEAIGCRLTPAGPEKLLGRIKAIAQMEQPPIHELAKWYEAIDKVVARSSASEIVSLQEEFKQLPLVFTQSNEWAKVGEVFRFVDDEGIPDTPTIHSAIAELMMWPRLGVADRPSPELVIEWLHTLPNDKRLDSQTRRRVKGCLQTFPGKIWNECGYWLSLDDRWSSVEEFEFRSTRDRSFRTADLFPKVKTKTADLRNLNESDYSLPHFVALRDIGQHLELRLTDSVASSDDVVEKTWLNQLGQCLSRVKIQDDPVKEKAIRSSAKQLANSTWRTMRSLQVTPYLDGEPAGQAFDADVIWAELDLFVKDQSLVTVYKSLVDELSRPFGLQAITDAIRACADRNDQFIDGYVNHHFDLLSEDAPELEVAVSEEPTELVAENSSNQAAHDELPAKQVVEGSLSDPQFNSATNGLKPNQLADQPEDQLEEPVLPRTSILESNQVTEAESNDQSLAQSESSPTTEPNAEDEFQELVPEKPKPEPAPKKPAKAPLIVRFAKANGFKWVVENHTAENSDKEQLSKSPGLFRWQISRLDGTVRTRLWLAPQSLTEGVELPAEIWNVLKQSPLDCTFVFEGNQGKPKCFSGEQIMRYFESGHIQLFPATYRIRQVGELDTASLQHASKSES